VTGGILNNCGLTVHITVRSGAGGVPNQIWGVGVRWGRRGWPDLLNRLVELDTGRGSGMINTWTNDVLPA